MLSPSCIASRRTSPTARRRWPTARRGLRSLRVRAERPIVAAGLGIAPGRLHSLPEFEMLHLSRHAAAAFVSAALATSPSLAATPSVAPTPSIPQYGQP